MIAKLVMYMDAESIDVSSDRSNELELSIKKSIVMKLKYGGKTFFDADLASYHPRVKNLP